ncbi:MAG TPA: YihY/virulence factor BrkB family protein [Bryobacteraceae bacterium]|nr:YihY/virulence factor BrkB family protein [Bryobacteraceae bacterium]
MRILRLGGRTLRQLFWLLRRTLIACFDDGLFTIAKGAAYSSLLSLFPVLTSAATIFIQIRADYVQQNLTTFLTQILPPDTETAVLEQFRLRGQRPLWLLVIAFLLSLWAASSVIKSLIDGFNAAYRVPRSRSMLAHSGVGIMLVFLAVIPLAGASSLILFGGEIESAVMNSLKVDPILNPLAPTWELLSRIMRYVISFLATCSLTAILYYYGPYRKQRWAAVWPGAFLATLLWLPATLGFAWYVRNITNYNVLYGSVGTSIALLVWMYLLAAIALFGCEFNAELERMRIALSAQRRI